MRKLPSWRFWDWNSISKTILVFAVIIIAGVIIKFYPNYSRKSSLEKLSESTHALVYDIKPVKHIDMDFDGNKIYDRGYTIKYYYSINSVTYQSKDYLRNTAENQVLLNKLRIDKSQIIQVAFDPQKPTKTQIIIE